MTEVQQVRNALQKQISLWRHGVGQELGFWDRWMASRGLEWPEDFEERLRKATPLHSEVARRLGMATERSVVLDVGSGPLSKIGRVADSGETPRIIACDPLMSQYLGLLEKYGLSPLSECVVAPAEDLSSYFPANFADVVHCSNALDHSFDPIRGIEEMLYVAKPGSSVILLHATNEAENENYEGFHQWNFDVIDGAFVVWNKEVQINADEYFSKFATMEASRSSDGRGVSAILTKKEGASEALSQMCDERRKQRVIDLHKAVMSLL